MSTTTTEVKLPAFTVHLAKENNTDETRERLTIALTHLLPAAYNRRDLKLEGVIFASNRPIFHREVAPDLTFSLPTRIGGLGGELLLMSPETHQQLQRSIDTLTEHKYVLIQVWVNPHNDTAKAPDLTAAVKHAELLAASELARKERVGLDTKIIVLPSD